MRSGVTTLCAASLPEADANSEQLLVFARWLLHRCSSPETA